MQPYVHVCLITRLLKWFTATIRTLMQNAGYAGLAFAVSYKSWVHLTIGPVALTLRLAQMSLNRVLVSRYSVELHPILQTISVSELQAYFQTKAPMLNILSPKAFTRQLDARPMSDFSSYPIHNVTIYLQMLNLTFASNVKFNICFFG